MRVYRADQPGIFQGPSPIRLWIVDLRYDLKDHAVSERPVGQGILRVTADGIEVRGFPPVAGVALGRLVIPNNFVLAYTDQNKHFIFWQAKAVRFQSCNLISV